MCIGLHRLDSPNCAFLVSLPILNASAVLRSLFRLIIAYGSNLFSAKHLNMEIRRYNALFIALSSILLIYF